MSIAPEYIFLVSSLLLYVSILAGRAGYKIGVPVLLFFLLVGMLFGSDGIGLKFDSAQHAQSVGMVAMSVILFAGGMDTQFKDIRPILKPGIVLSTAGVLLTAVFTGFFYLVAFGDELDGHWFFFAGCVVACRHDVVYGLRFCLCDTQFAKDAPQTKSASHARIGKR